MKRGLTRPRTSRASAVPSGRARGRCGSAASSTIRSTARPSNAAADPQRPRARPLGTALARLVRGRVNPRFIAGQMRHGARGAAELAETVDRLVLFAHPTGAVDGALFDLVYDAYLGDQAVRAFLERENADAARVIADRLDAARRLGLWHPRRNDLGADLLRHAEAVP